MINTYMKINEIITESMNCRPGWQDSEIIELPLNKGYLILSHRLNTNCEVDEITFVYHNENLVRPDQDNPHSWITSVRVKRGIVEIYDYFDFPEGKPVGKFTSVGSIKSLFEKMIRKYI